LAALLYPILNLPFPPQTFQISTNPRHGFCGSRRDGARVVESSIGRNNQSPILKSQRPSLGLLMGQGMCDMHAPRSQFFVTYFLCMLLISFCWYLCVRACDSECAAVWCERQCVERRVHARWSCARLLLPRRFLRFQCRSRQHC